MMMKMQAAIFKRYWPFSSPAFALGRAEAKRKSSPRAKTHDEIAQFLENFRTKTTEIRRLTALIVDDGKSLWQLAARNIG